MHDTQLEPATMPEIVGRRPDLTVLIVNYNSSDFLRLNIKALQNLTWCPVRIFICDNGSAPEDFFRLRYTCSNYANITLIARQQTGPGSLGHGEALNLLSEFLETPYGAVLDADCIPLMLHWDKYLIDQLDAKTKIAGTPVAHNSPKNKKPIDFPLMFLCLFETETFKRLGIDFRPKDQSIQQDTGWELRDKFLKAGYAGKTLFGQNTREYKGGPFAENTCDEYYTDTSCTRLICSHLGRGSNPNSGKYSMSRRQAKIAHQKDRDSWLAVCDGLLDGELAKLASMRESHLEMTDCEVCGPGPTKRVLWTPDLNNRIPGIWDIVRCDKCGLAFVNPRPKPSHMMTYYPDDYGPYQLANAGAGKPEAELSRLRRFKRQVRRQVLRQHFGYHRKEIGASLAWKILTLALRRGMDSELIPRYPDSESRPKLLEIGCSSGARLEILRGMGWDVCGIEPSPSAAQIARKNGFDVQTALVENAVYGKGEFDCIVMSMVLEHLHHPLQSLRQIGEWLKPGGELLISVPDFSGLEARVFKHNHYGLHVPNHLYHYTPASLVPFFKGYRYRITHEGYHRDLQAGLENFVRENPQSVFRHFQKVPRKGFTLAATLLAYFGKTSRMAIRAVKTA